MWMTTPTLNDKDRLIRLEEVMEITGVCRSVIYKLMKTGEFPPKITVGVRGARWSERLVRGWVVNKLSESIAKGSVQKPLTVTPESNVAWPEPLVPLPVGTAWGEPWPSTAQTAKDEWK